MVPAAETRNGGLFARFESDLIGAAVGHKRFPEIDVVAVAQGHDAVEAVRAARDEGRPFAVAFIDLHLARGVDGLRAAEQIRALDPDIHVVLVSAKAEVHPVEMSERVPPADQLFSSASRAMPPRYSNWPWPWPPGGGANAASSAVAGPTRVGWRRSAAVYPR